MPTPVQNPSVVVMMKLLKWYVRRFIWKGSQGPESIQGSVRSAKIQLKDFIWNKKNVKTKSFFGKDLAPRRALRKDRRDSLGLSLKLSIRGLIYCMATATISHSQRASSSITAVGEGAENQADLADLAPQNDGDGAGEPDGPLPRRRSLGARRCVVTR